MRSAVDHLSASNWWALKLPDLIGREELVKYPSGYRRHSLRKLAARA